MIPQDLAPLKAFMTPADAQAVKAGIRAGVARGETAPAYAVGA